MLPGAPAGGGQPRRPRLQAGQCRSHRREKAAQAGPARRESPARPRGWPGGPKGPPGEGEEETR
eukprot:10131628-Prorocentrum_lima.AAC.1